eukprot:jgi/Psemu1/303360/fgenesh1_kg.101_\
MGTSSNAAVDVLEHGEESATASGSPSSHDSLSGRDTVICSNNDKDTDNFNTEDASSGSTEAAGMGKRNTEAHSDTEKLGLDYSERSTEDMRSSINISDDVFAHSIMDEFPISNHQEGSTTSNVDPVAVDSNAKNGDNAAAQEEEETKSTSHTGIEESSIAIEDTFETDSEIHSMPLRLLNYTAMTLPCVDFPAMKKWNQTAAEKNSALIPPLHVTVTLMSDKDPSRRCFHCVFTNSKGTKGSLGIITPELLASLFAKPLRSSRRKKRYYSSQGGNGHKHPRKRARGGGTTRVGQSVSTANNGEEGHSVQQVSTTEQHDSSPSPLLMPPRGPPAEDNQKPPEAKSNKAINNEIEVGDTRDI